MDLSISIVSYNQRNDLERLLPTLIKSIKNVSAEILHVDCNSIDNTCNFIRTNYPHIALWTNYNRAGYGENHNINLRRCSGKYFVIMNADMTVQPDTFSSLITFMCHHEDVGVVAPKITNPDGSIQGLNKRYPNVCDLFLRRFLPAKMQCVFKHRMNRYEMRDIGYEHAYDVPFLSGSFMFCRTKILKNVGGFNPKYFLYFEDADLCRRIQKTHRTVYTPETSVVHFWKRSAHKNWLHTYYFICSAFHYFNTWGYKLI